MPVLIDGHWRETSATSEVHAPYDGAHLGTVHLASKDDVLDAIAAACRSFETTRNLPSHARSTMLHNVAAQISDRAAEFAHCISSEAGKPVKAARVEVERSILTFSTAAEEAGRIGGEVLPLDRLPSARGRLGIVRRFPIGPIAGITPFNFPLNLVAHKVAPALAAGNSFVLKPAPQTPLTALKLGEVLLNAGVPPGAVNIVPCDVENAAPLVTDERLKMLSFTGSPGVGWTLKGRAGKKKVTLELGGNAGVIVHSDADIEYAAQRIVFGGFGYAGQTCISVQRIFVHQTVLSSFLAAFLPKVEALVTGNPLDERTDVGPLIGDRDADRVEAWVREAAAAGATVLCGGTREGRLMRPTVLTGTSPTMSVNCREIFGPVVTVESYEHFEIALERLNDSDFGLQAGIFTDTLTLSLQAFQRLDVGGVIIGDVPTFRVDHMPYGGVKDSGFGREGVRYAIEEMTEPRLLVLNNAI
jgi:acyl-CoA reductase-like NAD-dependent aldehyde dehydrogenase